jgi:hypothetical protein
MSAQGHQRPAEMPPAVTHVRCAFNSVRISAAQGMTESATSVSGVAVDITGIRSRRRRRRWMTSSNLLDCRLCTLEDVTLTDAALTRADIHDSPEHESTLLQDQRLLAPSRCPL